MHTSTTERLGPLLDRPHAVLLRHELARLGVDDQLLERQVARGAWCRVAPSVVVTCPSPDGRDLALAALLHAGPRALLTGRAACRLYRMRDVPSGGPVAVLLPHEVRRVSTRHVSVLRTVTPVTRLVVAGLPTVPPARALLDAASGLSLRDVRALVLGGVGDDLVDLAEVEAVLRGARSSGSAAVRRALDDARRGALSAPEAELADLLRPWARQHRTPVLLNPWLVLDGVLVGRPDVLLPELGLGVEVDSAQFHGGRALTATLQRHKRLTDLGLLLGHETPFAIRSEPAAVLRRLDDDLRRRGREPWRRPDGLRVLTHDDPSAPRPRRAVRWWLPAGQG